MKLYTEKELKKLNRKKRSERRALRIYFTLISIVALGGFYAGFSQRDIEGFYLGYAIVLIVLVLPFVGNKTKLGRILLFRWPRLIFLGLLVLFVGFAWLLSYLTMLAIK